MVTAQSKQGESVTVLDIFTKILPLLGVVIYIILRLGQTAYAGTFGLTPEDIGLTYLTTLSAAGTSTLAIVVVLTLVLLGAFFVAVERNSRLIERLASVAGGLLTVFVLLAVGWVTRSLVAAFSAGIIFLGLLAVIIMSRKPHVRQALSVAAPDVTIEDWWPTGDSNPRTMPPYSYTIIAGSLLMAVSLVASLQAGRAAALSIQDGNVATVPLLDIRSQQVLVAGAPQALVAGSDLILLGRAGTRVVLWNETTRDVVSVPEAGVVLTVRRDDAD